ncbi:hypothetical protein STCU_12281 [Strigomonas culicis]|uniref:Uncharacterized protein n=1 Tax=Strigomonas culicis TaxID=28005 RepID=S9TE07_9TRYP|nr:hypothetical protein STCU_12281 [Strigomonas culicis]|eukprot:EPY15179.1 hypothetical protein STCU_12281 [Strigomonas culicis]
MMTPFAEPDSAGHQLPCTDSVFFSDSVINAMESLPPAPLPDPLDPLTPNTHCLINMFDQRRTEHTQKEWRKKQQEDERRHSRHSSNTEPCASRSDCSVHSHGSRGRAATKAAESELYHWTLQHFVEHFARSAALREELALTYPRFLRGCRQKELEVAVLQSAMELIARTRAEDGAARTATSPAGGERAAEQAVLAFLHDGGCADAEVRAEDFSMLLQASIETMLGGDVVSTDARGTSAGTRTHRPRPPTAPCSAYGATSCGSVNSRMASRATWCPTSSWM